MFGFFKALWYKRKNKWLEEVLEKASAMTKVYEQKARTAKANMDYNRTLAEQLTDEGRLDEARKYWAQVALAKKQFELYERRRRAWELASQKIVDGLFETFETQYSKRKFTDIRHSKRKSTDMDYLEVIFADFDFDFDKLKKEGELLMQEYLKQKQAGESQTQTEESELERALRKLKV